MLFSFSDCNAAGVYEASLRYNDDYKRLQVELAQQKE